MSNVRGCGETVAGCLGLLVLLIGGVGLWLHTSVQAENERSAREYEIRRSKIPLEAVAATDMRLSTGDFPQLTGRLFNSASESISSVTILVTVFDCPQQDSLVDCITVASESVQTFTTIPPGQARDVMEPVYLPPAMRIRGTLQWHYRVAEVVATTP